MAAAFQRGLVFLLLPVYTHVLNPGDYGRLSILLAVAAAANIVLSFGIDTAFFRTYFGLRGDVERQTAFVTTAWGFLLVIPPAAAALLGLLAAPFLLHSEVAPAAELALALAGSALFVSATVVPLALLRAQERLRDYLILTGVIAGTTAGFTLLAVVGLGSGVAGWFVAVIAANGVTFLVAARLIPLRPRAGFDRRLMASALALGLPLVPHMLSHWGLGVSNRLVLAGIVSTADVGVYSLASNLALPVAIVLTAVATGFMPTYARAATEPAALAALPQMVIVQFLVVGTVTASAALLGPIAVHYLAPPEYSAAAPLVPWLALGYGLLGLYFLPMNAVALTVGKTRRIWVITVFAAAVNLVCLLVIVPSAGLIGAALALAAGYLVLLVGIWLYSQAAGNPIRYQWRRMGRGALVFATVYVLALVTSGSENLLDAGIRIAWLVALAPLLVLTRVLDRTRVLAAVRGLTTRTRLTA